MNSSKLQFYNTLTREKEEFVPLNGNEVGMYTCGPTVYDYAHIGNLRAYVFSDIVSRTLKYKGYKVKKVMNITDVGHLSSDADSGDDKMTKGLLREGKELTLENMRGLAEFYAGKFKEDISKMNIELPDEMPFATDYIKEDIDIIKALEEKGFAYKTSDGVYFEVSKMPDYGILWGGKREVDEGIARVEKNSEKKDQRDFALWKFNEKLGFPSPWGNGFPGWHIECSAMSMKFLGEQFDIHTGGIDHIPTHHTNEIAQSECATGKKPFVKYWMHSEFIDVSGAKMAKSQGNFLKLSDITDKGIDPLAYRFWILMGSYRTKLNFHWEALEAAQVAFKRLESHYLELGNDIGSVNEEYRNKFSEYMADDLNTPRAISLLWDLMKDENISAADKKATLNDFDMVLGLGFKELKPEIVPDEVKKLAEEYDIARKEKNYERADNLRKEIESVHGYKIEQNKDTYKIVRKTNISDMFKQV